MIKVIGVGQAGGNILEDLMASGPDRAKKAAQAALASLALNQCRLDAG